MNLSLVKQENFNSVMCNFYRNGKQDIWMTREQIGQALEYSEPMRSVSNLHNRNKERLDKFSVVTKLMTTDGKQYDTTIYSTKGVYEICRWSKQPKANAFLDWVWDIVEAFRLGEVKRVDDYDKKFREAIDPLKLLGFDDSIERVDKYTRAMYALATLAKIGNYSEFKVLIEHEGIKEELGIGSL